MRSFLIGLAIGFLFVILYINLGSSFKSDQPLSFNHKKHLNQGLECNACHRFYKTQTFSGIPNLNTCLECHQDPLTKSSEEEKIRQSQRIGKDITWKRIYEQPDHVFFSHRRHVVLGKLDCKNCHGDVGQSERPPTKPWVKMTMKWCMDCHTKSKVTNDCLACHV